MHFAVDPKHLEFFHHHHYIEFEELLTAQEVKTIREAVESVLAKRLHTEPDTLSSIDTHRLYQHGYDTWRSHPKLQHYILKPQLAAIMSHLTKQRPLCIGFDQVFKSGITSAPFLDVTTHLKQMSCIEGIVGGCILNLGASSCALLDKRSPILPLSRAAGNALFFKPTLGLQLEPLIATPHTCQLLITYSKKDSLYTYNAEDTHTHSLKQFGYVFGDRLKTTTHPIIYAG